MASASSGYSVVPAVCVGIAACAAAIYVLWGPDYLFRKKGRAVVLSGEGVCSVILY